MWKGLCVWFLDNPDIGVFVMIKTAYDDGYAHCYLGSGQECSKTVMAVVGEVFVIYRYYLIHAVVSKVQHLEGDLAVLRMD